MTECTRNVELFYLLGKLTPDFRTIADFRKDNAKALKNVFSAFVKLCVKLGLYQKEPSPEQIKAAIHELTLRKEKYQEYLKELFESGETQILTTDPEVHRMHTKDGFNCCYNVQTAVDKGSHLIAGYEVTNKNNDQGLLKEVADIARQELEVETLEVTADKGYESRRDIEECVMNT